MGRIFFTADTHFNHANIINFVNRPFDSVEEMNESLIESWNNTVSKDDEVYFLGDFSLGSSKNCLEILERLNGIKYSIKGNHEKSLLSNARCKEHFVWIKDMHELKINKQDIILCHYAMRVWNKSHWGSFQLYGHSHDGLDRDGDYNGLSMDVGVDAAYRILGEYRPFSYDEILEIMTDRDRKNI